MATKTVWATYRSGMSQGRGTKVHAMKEVRHPASVWYMPLCGADHIKVTRYGVYDSDRADACQRCARLQHAVDVEV